MDHIMNMEYSLYAIGDIIGIQIIENVNMEFVYYRSEYPFCKEPEYMTEVSAYLVKYNNNALKDKLKWHLAICEVAIDAWESILKNIDKKNIEHELYGYNFYCWLHKTVMRPPFHCCFAKDSNDVRFLNPFDEKYKPISIDSLVDVVKNIKFFLHLNGIIEASKMEDNRPYNPVGFIQSKKRENG